jgi:hypothetical protein
MKQIRFLKEMVGNDKPKELKKIEIKPITDAVYKFIENKNRKILN